jgi:ABC-type transport system involved in multi-copper enzyme maturation permease subunit
MNEPSEVRGLLSLALLTLRRQYRTKKTLLAIVLIGFACLSAVRWRALKDPNSARQQLRNSRTPEWLRENWPDRWIAVGIVAALRVPTPIEYVRVNYRPNPTLYFAEENAMRLFVGFFLPILCLLYAAAALGEEYEERTFVYVLSRPLTLWKVYLAKGLGIAPLVVAATIGGFGLLCLSAGSAGLAAWPMFWPAVAFGAFAYTSLFLMIGALAPRPMVVGVGYAFFFEFIAGNLPGTIKRASISFHTKCMMYDAGSNMGFQPLSARQFMPVSGETAMAVLLTAGLVLLAVGAWRFHRREYRDLT